MAVLLDLAQQMLGGDVNDDVLGSVWVDGFCLPFVDNKFFYSFFKQQFTTIISFIDGSFLF